jgi:hypothetical protein
MAYARFNESKMIWTWTCAGCGQQLQTNDHASPLDGLDCCSAECDRIVEARVISRSKQMCARCECEIDSFDGTCGCDPPGRLKP